MPLDVVPPSDEPRYEPALIEGNVAPALLCLRSISQLLGDALGLSAWKQAGDARWALRVNPSSGDLHPTEGYLVGAVPGLLERPSVCHYNPHDHCLEVCAELPHWPQGIPEGAVLIGLSSIWWRESWKYGERAFRYCQHDLGHALAAIAVAAAGLGWSARLLEGVTDREIAALLGIAGQTGPEAEHAEALVAVFPQGAWTDAAWRDFRLPPLPAMDWKGNLRALSAEHHDWPVIDPIIDPIIDDVAAATVRGASLGPEAFSPARLPAQTPTSSPPSRRRLVHQRRSAVDMDGRTGLTREALSQVLQRTLPMRAQVPFAALPWRPLVHLALFVHRVEGLDPGMYLLVRDPLQVDFLAAHLSPDFAWTRPDHTPDGLFLLKAGDARATAAGLSCGQDIASDGAFAVAMLAEFRGPMEAWGACFYRRLHWEAGAIGQVLYLEAEASGVRGTGIGCFVDQATHDVLGLKGDALADLYHFTVGGPVEDTRLQTLPPYAHLTAARR